MFFKYKSDWHRIPVWANFFFDLGNCLASETALHKRTVVAVALPTRAFATALTAAGVVKNNLGCRVMRNNAEHFAYLCGLPQGTPVKCVEKGRQKTYLLKGLREMHGEQWLIIQMSGKRDGNAERSVPLRLCHEIQLADVEPNRIASDERLRQQKGRQVHKISDFARDFLRVTAETSFSLETSLNCLVVGRKSLLQDELFNTTFSVGSDNKFGVFNKVGILQDVLRVRQFNTSEQPSHCEFLPSDARRKLLKRNPPPIAPIVIFDGANGFLRLRDYLRRSHWIVMLDRTETNFQNAIELLNQDFAGRESEEIPSNFPTLPAEIEAMIYTEKLR